MANEHESKEVFALFDADNSGAIDFPEFKQAYSGVLGKEHTDGREEELRTLFNKFDVNQNGQLEFSEFVALMLSLNSNTSNAKVAEFFEKIDVNGDKMLSADELRQALAKYKNMQPDDEQINKLMQTLDLDKDGSISFA